MKKSLSILLAIILVVSLFTGCDKDKKPKVESKAELTSEYDKSTELVGDPTATGELKIGYYGSVTSYNGKPTQLEVAVDKFKKLYPGVIVTFEDTPFTDDANSCTKKLMSDVKSEKCPDVMILYNFMKIERLIKDNFLLDINEYLDKDTSINLNEYNTSVLLDSQQDDRQLFIPLNYTFSSLITSQSLVKEHNINVEKFQNYASCAEEVAQIIKKNKGNTKITSAVTNLDYPYVFPWLADMDYSKPEDVKALLNDIDTRKAFEQYKTVLRNSNPNYNADFISVTNQLKSKKIILTELNIGLDNAISAAKVVDSFDKSIMIPWRNKNGNIQGLWQQCGAISKKSKNKQNAYNFIKVMLSTDVQLTPPYGSDLYFIPISNVATKKHLAELLLSKETITAQNKEKAREDATSLINEFMEYLNQMDGTALSWDIHGIIRDSMSPYFNYAKSYEECIADAEKKIQAYVFG